MRIHAITTAGFSPKTQKVQLYTKVRDLSSFGYLQRSSVRDLTKFVSRVALSSLEQGTRCSITEKNQMVHILVSPNEKFAVYVFATLDYPKRLAYKVLHKTLELFENNVGSGWKD